MADAKQKRNEQLKRWLGSETDLEPPILKKKKTKVKFDDGAVFLAACSSGDTEEVLRMLDRGADINYANVDGLTALHQVCVGRDFCVVNAAPGGSDPGTRSSWNTCQMEASLIPRCLPTEHSLVLVDAEMDSLHTKTLLSCAYKRAQS